MVYYELKKIFGRTSNLIAVGFLLVILVSTCFSAIGSVQYINEAGETKTGIGAIHKLRDAKNEWRGVLSEDKIAAVIAENNRINQTPEYQSDNVTQQQIAYSQKQGFADIRSILVTSFGKFREYDYYMPDSLSPEDSVRFYENRTTALQTWFDTDAKQYYSDKEKEFLLTEYQNLETPFYYESIEGWVKFRDYVPKIIMITVLVVGFLLSGVFPRETQLEADSIFYSAYYGRNRAVHAKLKACFVLASGVYWLMLILFSVVIFGIMGTDGAGCVIQIRDSSWRSFYHLTNFQEYLLTLLGGYVGTLFFSFLTVLVSAKTKSAVFAVLTPFILIFIPSFLSGITNPVIAKTIGLLPNQLLQIPQVTSTFDLYQIGSRIVSSMPILFVLYTVAAAGLYPLIYQIYRKAQVK